MHVMGILCISCFNVSHNCNIDPMTVHIIVPYKGLTAINIITKYKKLKIRSVVSGNK
jgi:hypothetical protein